MEHDVVETSGDRKALVRDAGWGRVSFGSVVTGMLVAYGAFAILAGIVGAITEVVKLDTDHLADNGDWRGVGLGVGVAAAIGLYFTFLYGGYVAGRLARRAGALNGFLVFVLGGAVIAAAGGILGSGNRWDSMVDDLRQLGAPTARGQWIEVGTGVALALMVAMATGAIVGGLRGERWHGKLLARAMEPHEIEEEAPTPPPTVDLTAEETVRREREAQRVRAEAEAEAADREHVTTSS